LIIFFFSYIHKVDINW